MDPKDLSPIVDPDIVQTVKNLSDEDLRKMSEFKNSDRYKELVDPIRQEIKTHKRNALINYLKSNWINLSALLFAFISALPVIIKFISSLAQ